MNAHRPSLDDRPSPDNRPFPNVSPQHLARDLQASIDEDHLKLFLDPQNPKHCLDLARWGRGYGLFEARVRADQPPDPRPRLSDEEVARWIQHTISPHPAEFQEVAEACRQIQGHFLKAQVKRLESCGTVWWNQQVLRVFWKDRRGRERLRRQVGIHRCKHAWCPSCGRSKQAQRTAEVERIMLLARDFGFDEGHARLVTLTVPNGPDIQALRQEAHHAFAKLQRTRWWNHQAFGWVRGSEVVTGEDGNWNLHIHLLVVFWSPRVSYSELGKVWTQELGGLRSTENGAGKRFVVDCMTLEALRFQRKDGKPGFLKRKGGLMRAARYITKYLTKAEDIQKLKGGPGGLAHLMGATSGMRRFSVGGGCSVLRRTASVLLPARAFQAEEALAGTYLHEGRMPCRVEALDPATGELLEVTGDRLKDGRHEALKDWGEALETNPIPGRGEHLPGRVVGVPAGPKGRYRRLGPTPLASRAPTVAEFEKHGSSILQGARALIAGGDWKVYRWEELSQKSGKLLKFAAVLPRVRYAWRPLRDAMHQQLAHGTEDWTLQRQKANRAGAFHLVQGEDRMDALRAVYQGLNDQEVRGQAKPTHQRAEKAAELARWRYELLKKRSPEDEALIQRLTAGIDALRRPNPLWTKPSEPDHLEAWQEP